MFLNLATWGVLALLILIVAGAVALGVSIGRIIRRRPDQDPESLGPVQAALLGFVGLLLAFGLSMSTARYESRRAIIVDQANALSTAYLRAQLLDEPARGRTLELFPRYADAVVELATSVPNSAEFDRIRADIREFEDALWAIVDEVVRADPLATAPRVYVEAVNTMFDSHESRVASLRNRVPSSVVVVEVAGSAIALGVLALYVTMRGNRLSATWLTAGLAVLILFVSLDLDRPQQGMITLPYDPLVDVRQTMTEK